MDYTEPLQVVYCDLWDPTLMTPSMGYKYYVSFIDAFNRHTWIYILKTKDETLFEFKEFRSLVELQLYTKLKAIQIY